MSLQRCLNGVCKLPKQKVLLCLLLTPLRVTPTEGLEYQLRGSIIHSRIHSIKYFFISAEFQLLFYVSVLYEEKSTKSLLHGSYVFVGKIENKYICMLAIVVIFLSLSF